MIPAGLERRGDTGKQAGAVVHDLRDLAVHRRGARASTRPPNATAERLMPEAHAQDRQPAREPPQRVDRHAGAFPAGPVPAR